MSYYTHHIYMVALHYGWGDVSSGDSSYWMTYYIHHNDIDARHCGSFDVAADDPS